MAMLVMTWHLVYGQQVLRQFDLHGDIAVGLLSAVSNILQHVFLAFTKLS